MDFDLEIDEERCPLTKKQSPILLLIARGFSREVIAAMLNRSVETVNTHVAHIYQKLDVDNEKQAITAAFVKGIVKAKKTLVLCLVITSTGNALMPSPVVASTTSDLPIDVPDSRVFRGRQGVRVRHGRAGSRKAQSRREKLFFDCFGEF